MNGIPSEPKGYRLVTWKKEPPDSRSKTKGATLLYNSIPCLCSTGNCRVRRSSSSSNIRFQSGHDDTVFRLHAGALVALGNDVHREERLDSFRNDH